NVDAVYIPLPNELHKPWVLAAADAGKHVLCEKPLALDAAEAHEMAGRCEDKGVVLMEAFMWRNQPRTARLRELVEAGAIGEPRLVRSSFSFPIEPDDWRLDPARGGGALWDVGCYGVNTARLFAGEDPERVRSVARFGPTEVDLSLTAELLFPSGIIGLVDCSFEQPFRCSYELVGTTGVIEVPNAYLPPSRPIAIQRDASGKVAREWTFEGDDQYGAMVDAFAESVRRGSLISPCENGVAQMAILDEIRATARSS
ncbi:MAG: Gfo/Idh/MocA family protein, partial [Isosphaeraceae bacterium]